MFTWLIVEETSTNFSFFFDIMIVRSDFKLNTNKKFQIIDITPKINELTVIEEGIVNIFSKHSTSAIVINENEKGLLEDFEFMLENLIDDKYSWQHDRIDNNTTSHLKSFLLSSSETLPVKNSKLDLGTWQSVFFVELDGPRSSRTVNLTFIGK